MKAEHLDNARKYLSALTALKIFANEVHEQSGNDVKVKIIVNGNSCEFSQLALKFVEQAIATEEKMIRNTLEIYGVEL
jgi:hypothetical protein